MCTSTSTVTESAFTVTARAFERRMRSRLMLYLRARSCGPTAHYGHARIKSSALPVSLLRRLQVTRLHVFKRCKRSSIEWYIRVLDKACPTKPTPAKQGGAAHSPPILPPIDHCPMRPDLSEHPPNIVVEVLHPDPCAASSLQSACVLALTGIPRLAHLN